MNTSRSLPRLPWQGSYLTIMSLGITLFYITTITELWDPFISH
jgi:hypothetical protein